MGRNSLAIAPFPPDYRAAGLLLHVTSLPSPHGVGDLGPVALSWIDRLGQAGLRWWQMLPLGPIGKGNSPYDPLSSFAGNPLLISPEWLVDEGLLRTGDVVTGAFPATVVDYDAVTPFKNRLLEKAWDNFRAGERSDLRAAYEQFCHDENHWLKDFALFQALKAKFNNAHYLEWPRELVWREPAALNRERQALSGPIERACFAQFLFFRQAERLKAYAHAKGVRLMGDTPFFVSADSSDVWANPEVFLLDEQRRPHLVAGVPPDYFSATGQLWGNPLYNWDNLRQSGYRWWIDRLRSMLSVVDVVRLDHFRGFVAAWHVPAGAQTAQVGTWEPGPGAQFFEAVEKELGHLPFIAEDLGMITPDVYALRDQFHFPGMIVLQFAFDGGPDNPYLPENHIHNAVAYTGTHDNPPTRGWFENLAAGPREKITQYLKEHGTKSNEVARALLELAWSSQAALAIAPLQDLLNLGNEARMNVPGRPENNWQWRATGEMLFDPAFEWLRQRTKEASRLGVSTAPSARTMEAASMN